MNYGAAMPFDQSATVQSVTALEASVRARTDTDTRFINWWLYMFLLSWLTLGIAAIYYFVKRISRVDEYSRRKQDYYAALITFTERYGQASDQRVKADPVVRDMQSALEWGEKHHLRPIGALKSFLLTIVTLGIYGIVAWYQVNRAWADRQVFERELDELLSKAWLTLGITRYPVTFEPARGKDRNFWLYLVLTLVTFGIWGLVWDYKVHNDPNNIYPRIHQVEDTAVQLARSV